MTTPSDRTGYVVSQKQLPENFPTHMLAGSFWEELGRTVATFGFLEETMGKAIFAFTATREIPNGEVEAALEAWLPTLQRALSDPLGGLIDAYGKAVRDHKDATITNFDDLLTDLRRASVVRNVLCHGSWRMPDADGRSTPYFFDRKLRKFDTPVDVAYFQSVRTDVARMTCDVINTVTYMGWSFPGSTGPGKPIVTRD